MTYGLKDLELENGDDQKWKKKSIHSEPQTRSIRIII